MDAETHVADLPVLLDELPHQAVVFPDEVRRELKHFDFGQVFQAGGARGDVPRPTAFSRPRPLQVRFPADEFPLRPQIDRREGQQDRHGPGVDPEQEVEQSGAFQDVRYQIDDVDVKTSERGACVLLRDAQGVLKPQAFKLL